MAQESNVQIAYKEIQAIAEKYKVSGLVVVSDPSGNHIRAGHFHMDREMIGIKDSKSASNLLNDLGSIVNRTFMLLVQNIFKIDITLQSITQGDVEAYNEIYSEIEKQMSNGADTYLTDLEDSLKATHAEFKRVTGKDIPKEAPQNIKPKTMNKIRQIGNVLAGTYYTPSN